MDIEDNIDFETILLLKKCPSKQYLKKFLEYAFMIRNKVCSFDKFFKTQVADQFFVDLELNEQTCHKVIVNTIQLIQRAAQIGFTQAAQSFPENFDEQLQALFVELFGVYGEIWAKSINSAICQADRLVDIDWRIDVQVAAHNAEKINNQIVFIQLDVQNQQNNESKQLNFQMNNQELNSFYNNLQKIKDQLNELVTNQ